MKRIYLNYRFKEKRNIDLKDVKISKELAIMLNSGSPYYKKLGYYPEYRSHVAHEYKYNLASAYDLLIEGTLGIITKQQMKTAIRTGLIKKRDLLQRYYNLDARYVYPIRSFLETYRSFKKDFDTKGKHEFYKEIRIPKRKQVDGKTVYRVLNEPSTQLKKLQEEAKYILEDVFQLTAHNSAHAYVKGRDNVTNAQQHRFSKHIIEFDFKDYFDSITPTLIRKTLACFPPFFYTDDLVKVPGNLWYDSESSKNTEKKALGNRLKEEQKELLEAIIDIATYRNGIPQGSPLSPLISNLVMFEFDHLINKELHKQQSYYSKTMIIYTRYCDNLTFSSYNPINLNRIKTLIKSILAARAENVRLNEKKTKYLKTNRRTYVTGVKLNREQRATYGHEKKDKLKRDLFHLFMMYKEGNKDIQQARETIGHLSYMQRIEPAYTKNLIKKYCRKFNMEPSGFYSYFLN